VLQTALHWAAKHGKEDIIKLIAGTYKDYIKSVNVTTVSIRRLSEEGKRITSLANVGGLRDIRYSPIALQHFFIQIFCMFIFPWDPRLLFAG